MTIYTVATRAGVSIATVSRVLRGTARASPATRQKVLRAVEDLDYVPLRAASRLDIPRHETHGLVLPGLKGPWYAELLAGFEATAGQLGQSVIVHVGDQPSQPDALQRLLDRVDGIVVANDTLSDAHVARLAQSTPIVLIARAPIPGCDSVGVENAEGARQLTAHLIGHDRRRLVFVGDPDGSHDIGARYAGFGLAVAQSAAREARPPIRVAMDETSGARVAETLSDPALDVDGIVCANDELAIATLAHLAARSIRVPERLAVVGFDDLMMSRYVSPGLTTARQPTRALGRWAAIRLHERIEGRRHDVQPQVLPTRLVIRGSCGCAWSGPGADLA